MSEKLKCPHCDAKIDDDYIELFHSAVAQQTIDAFMTCQHCDENFGITFTVNGEVTKEPIPDPKDVFPDEE